MTSMQTSCEKGEVAISLDNFTKNYLGAAPCAERLLYPNRRSMVKFHPPEPNLVLLSIRERIITVVKVIGSLLSRLNKVV